MKKGLMLESAVKKTMARSEMPVLIAVLSLGVIFAITSSNFLSAYNIYNISRSAALYVFIALSQAMVMIVGGMNLSIGFIGGLSIVAVGHVMQNLGAPGWIAILVGLTVGIVAGFINGILIVKLKLNSFVVTLSTSFIFKGLVTGFSKGFPYTELDDSFMFVGTEKLFGLPVMVYLAIIILTIMWYFFKFTVAGRRILATGGNETAAKMAAVNVDKAIVIANVLSGIFAAIAGMCAVSMGGTAQPSTGTDWMIYSFAVAVIGGTALKGGVFNAAGIFIAGFLIIMIKNGLVMIDANYYYEQAYLGLILLVAVSLSSISTFSSKIKKRREFTKRE